jgi:hypothetical protein
MKRDLRAGRVNVHKFFHQHMDRPKLGNRYTTYDTKKGGTLTIVNLKEFHAWLQGAVLREKLKEMQQQNHGAHT